MIWFSVCAGAIVVAGLSIILRTGRTLPAGSTYADVRTPLIALGRRVVNAADHGSTEELRGDFTLLSKCSLLEVGGGGYLTVRDSACGPISFARAENGPAQSLRAEVGVIGLNPRLPDRTPPRARLDRNSCSCMIRFMFGPIHLLFCLTASYASCTLIDGSLYRPYATTRLAERLTPH